MPFITQGKTNLKYVLIVVILAAIAGGGYWFYWNWQIAKRAEKLTQFPETKKPEKVKDETTNWKTYESSEIGFSIKYPPEGSVPDEDIGEEVYPLEDIPLPGILRKGLGVSIFFSNDSYDMDVMIERAKYYSEDRRKEYTFEEVVSKIRDFITSPPEEYQEGVKGFKEEKIKLSNVQAFKFYAKGDKEIIYLIFAPIKEEILNVEVSIPPEKQKISEPIFNQIISTFRFLE